MKKAGARDSTSQETISLTNVVIFVFYLLSCNNDFTACMALHAHVRKSICLRTLRLCLCRVLIGLREQLLTTEREPCFSCLFNLQNFFCGDSARFIYILKRAGSGRLNSSFECCKRAGSIRLLHLSAAR